MTVSSTTSKVSFSGNGSTTAFAVSFYFLANSDLKVTLRKADGSEVVKTLSTDYTVTGAGNTAGGSVIMSVAPASGETLVVTRSVALTQPIDYQPNDPFPANTHEQALDRLTMITQQINETLGRAIKVSTTNTINSPEFTVDAATRANKVLSFDATGELAVTQELGTYKGNWASGTTYAVRSIIKDTSNANIYICLTAHTASGAQPISTNTDSAKWALLVDAATATSSASAAASSASAASTSASNAATSASNASSSASSASTSANTATTQASNASTSASNASTSATNAANSATAAANSATTAAAAAASGLYRQVLDKTANYTVVAADQGTLFRMNTGSGALTVTLPAISTVTDGFKVSVVKWTGDANGVTINRAGSDTINGATSSTIGAQYSQTTFVADFETNTWLAVQSGLGSTNVTVDVFSGNGSTTAFTLSGDPGTKNNTFVHISGVYQNKSTYSQSGTTITFSTAPPSGTSNIEIVWTQPLSVGVPSDASVTTAKIVDGAVTTAKHADASITPAKMANSGAEFGMRNRIINGAMVIDQRNAGASVTPTTNFTYTLDRWVAGLIQSSKFSVQQNAGSVTPPAGFSNYLGVTSLSAYSLTSTDYFNINQFIEGFNWADLAWGTASAATVTLSFWVRSSLTGTFGGALANSAGSRAYPFTYTISAANTWEQKTVTIAGDTTGTWVGATSGIGARLWISLGTGSSFATTAGAWAAGNYVAPTGATSVVGTSGATFYITGVQLEKGSTATSFDYRPYGTELALCQRYYWKLAPGATSSGVASGFYTATTQPIYSIILPVPMRSQVINASYSALTDFACLSPGAADAPSAIAFTGKGYQNMRIDCTAPAKTAGNGSVFQTSTTSAYLAFEAEL